MIYLAGLIITLFLSLILVSKKGKTQADIILLIWLIIIGLNLFLYYLQINSLIYEYPFLLGWIFPLPLLQWALLFLYISSITSKKKLDYRISFHFIPFLLSTTLIFQFFLLPANDKIEIYRNYGYGYETAMYINFIAFLLLGIIYLSLSVIKLRQYRKVFKNEFSNSEKINLSWVQFLIAGMSIIFLVILLNGSDKLIYSCETVFVIFIGYYGIKQVGIFNQMPHAETIQIENPINLQEQPDVTDSESSDKDIEEVIVTSHEDIVIKEKKYQKSTLTEELALKIHEDLQKIMQEGRLFENPELTLDEVANALHVLPNHLSQVINTKENKNFYDYINQLRVQHFILLVSKPENSSYTILSIAFECGFNSKTAFNRNFKKITGLSPTDYLNNA
jgi:AraC-like DNA-binding protein